MDLPEKKIETVAICRNKNAASILPNENWDFDQFTYEFAMIYYVSSCLDKLTVEG